MTLSSARSAPCRVGAQLAILSGAGLTTISDLLMLLSSMLSLAAKSSSSSKGDDGDRGLVVGDNNVAVSSKQTPPLALGLK